MGKMKKPAGPLSRWLGRAFRSSPLSTLADPDKELLMALGAVDARTGGREVSEATAMRQTVFYTCVRVIAESIASLPLKVYRAAPDDKSIATPARDRTEYALLTHAPNEHMSAFTWLEMIGTHLSTGGNHYSIIERDSGGAVIRITPVSNPQATAIREDRNGEWVYGFAIDHQWVWYNQWEVIHIPALSTDGVKGLSPLRAAAQAVGLALNAEDYGSKFFSEGANPSGFISLPGNNINENALTALRNSWNATYAGMANAHKTAILMSGAEWKRITIPPDEAQFLETRKFQVGDIARVFRIPPHMVGDLERATFSNIEHQDLAFVRHTLRPWLIRIESELNRKLFLSPLGKVPEYHCEFVVDGLLRGDVKTRTDYYAKGRQSGWLSANDIRKLEMMPPVEGGDSYDVPAFAKGGMANVPAEPPEAEDEGEDDEQT